MAVSNKVRLVIGALSLSAAGLVHLVEREDFVAVATKPTPLDVPTYGFGSTTKADGSAVRLGERITPPAALRLAVSDISGKELMVQRCASGVTLTQAEYDLYIDFVYNVGVQAFCGSTMLRLLKAGDYVGACNQFPRWKFQGQQDCSAPGNRICGGLWTSRLASQAKCLQLAAEVGA